MANPEFGASKIRSSGMADRTLRKHAAGWHAPRRALTAVPLETYNGYINRALPLATTRRRRAGCPPRACASARAPVRPEAGCAVASWEVRRMGDIEGRVFLRGITSEHYGL